MILLSTIGGLILLVILIVVTYLLLLPIGTLIPVNRKFKPVKNGIDIFVSTNGMHVDYIVPTQNQLFDWTRIIDSTPYDKPLTDYPYLGIGWGDPGFYLELETWDKLPFSIAAKALLYPTPTIMHVTGYDTLPYDTLRVEKITISPSSYVHLSSFIYNAFRLDPNQNLDLIPEVGYTPHDNFYQAHGVYHAFHTCNYWINKGLKRIGVRTALWSPLEKGIFYQLDRIKTTPVLEEMINSRPVNQPS